MDHDMNHNLECDPGYRPSQHLELDQNLDLDIRLVATDLDGTLLDGNSELSPKTLEVLKRADEAGIIFVAATGRPYEALPEPVRESRYIQYAITSNGTAIYRMSDRKRLYSNSMSRDNVEELLALLAGYPCPLEVYIDGAAYAEARYYADPMAYGIPERSAAYVRKTRRSCDDVPALLRENIDRVDGIDIVSPDPTLKDEIRAKAAHLPDLYVTASASHYLEFAAGSASKRTALNELAGMLGLVPSQVMSFGDGENDSEMLEFAGVGVAMGNASPLLIEYADRVTGSNLEDGVALAIERWVLK
jgi:Cof subfamily protein (haloacid dehalogenase superfamily)